MHKFSSSQDAARQSMLQSSQPVYQQDCTPTSLEWISKLVSFDTTSRESNLGLIEMVRDYLRREGIESSLTYDPFDRKANLFATIPGASGATQGGVVLSGHTDVVPVDGQMWDSDPFKAEVRGDKLYGRGTCDMKAFIGTALALIPEMRRASLQQPMHLALSYDEEVGCLGAPVMLQELKSRGIRLDGCIVGEPTSMRVVVAHKSQNSYRCCVRGHAAHSSLTPSGANAIEYAARLICFIRDLADELRANGPFDDAFDVPFSTGQTGTIHGGIALNTVPDRCEFSFEYRTLPGIDPQRIFERIKAYAHGTLLPKMHAEHPDTAIELAQIAAVPSLDSSEQEAIAKLVRALTLDRERRKVAYTTEAGHFQLAGIPTVLCGPGDVLQAHKPNEFVALSQIAQCEAFLRKVIRSLEESSI